MAYHLWTIKSKLKDFITRGEELLKESNPSKEDIEFESVSIDDYLFELDDLTSLDWLNMMTETQYIDKEANEVIGLIERARELLSRLDSLRDE